MKIEQLNNTGRLGFTRKGVSDYKGVTFTPYGTKSLYAWKSEGGNTYGTRINDMTEWDDFNVTGGDLPLSDLGEGTTLQSKIYEIIVFTRVITDTEYNLIRQYLNDKWQLGLE